MSELALAKKVGGDVKKSAQGAAAGVLAGDKLVETAKEAPSSQPMGLFDMLASQRKACYVRHKKQPRRKKRGANGGARARGKTSRTKLEQRERSSLQFGETPVFAADCAACAMDATVWPDGAEARGLVHSLFALRDFFTPLFVLYRDAFAKRGVDTRDAECSPRRQFAELLNAYGIALDARCSALVGPFETARPLRRSRAEQTLTPMLCPNVHAVLEEAWRAICGGADTLTDDEQNFFDQVLLDTLVYWHEAALRRSQGDRTQTLLGVEREYESEAAESEELRALRLQRERHTFLAEHKAFSANQSSPLTRLRYTASDKVVHAAGTIVDSLSAEPPITLANAAHRFCALLRSPVAEPSYRDYCWPGKLSFTLEGYRIDDEGRTPQLVNTTIEPRPRNRSGKKKKKTLSSKENAPALPSNNPPNRLSLLPSLLGELSQPPLEFQPPPAYSGAPNSAPFVESNPIGLHSPPSLDELGDDALRLAFGRQPFFFDPPPLDEAQTTATTVGSSFLLDELPQSRPNSFCAAAPMSPSSFFRN